MFSDELSLEFAVASVLLGFLAAVIVGSQNVRDARSVAGWTALVLVPMLLVSVAALASPTRWGLRQGAQGMVLLCAILLLSVRLGCRIARRGALSPHAGRPGKNVKPVEPDERPGP